MGALRARLFALAVTGAFALYLIVGWLLTFHAHFFIGDTLSRIANAYYIVYSRDPHLAAIGLDWLPLPSVLELPFVILLKPLGAVIFAGAIVTALFSAANIVLLRRILRRMGVAGRVGALLLLIYALNPFVLFYAGNGMSEALFITTILLLTESMMAWSEGGAPAPLLAAGVACALAWGIRFEAVAIFATGVFVIGTVWWLRYRDNTDRLEGEILAFVVPFVYVVVLWILANWLIAGSPTYFLNGAGNTSAYSVQLLRSSNVAYLYHHVIPTAAYVLARCEWFMPALVPLLLAATVISVARRRALELIPLAFPGAVLLFHIYMLYELQTYGEFRYYCYSLPLGIVAAGLVIAGLPRARTRRGHWWRRVTLGVILSATALSLPSTLLAMNTYAIGRQEQPLLALVRGHPTARTALGQWRNEQAMAAYVDGLRLGNGRVLLDTTAGFAIDLFSQQPKQFIIPSDHDFQATLDQLGQFPGYVLVSRQKGHESLFIATRYPALLSNGASWAHLQHQIGPWLLYRIVT